MGNEMRLTGNEESVETAVFEPERLRLARELQGVEPG